MKAVAPGEREIANIYEADYEPFINSDGDEDGLVLQLDRSKRLGTGFHVYKMEPGYTTVPHEHRGNEEFLLIQGDAVDNDGTVYREGDLVLMKSGTQHFTYSEKGCILAVFIPTPEESV